MKHADDDRPDGTLGPALDWFAALGGVGAWLVHIFGRYPLVPVACEADAAWVLHLVTASMGTVAVLATGVAWRLYRRTSPPAHRTDSRRRFMARAGLALNPLFLVVILAELLPALVQGPCT